MTVSDPKVGETFIGPYGARCTVDAIEGETLVVRAGKGTMRFPLSDWRKWLKREG